MTEINQAVLERALRSDSDLSQASLATKILLSRLRKEVANDPNSIGAQVAELKAFFQKHSFASRDLSFM
ncbi:MAG: hypothetical protein AAGH41_10515 [Pseudomonadota bacterium]